MTQAMAIINGELMPLDDANIGVMDLGFLRGLAVFETIRTYNEGCPFALEVHLNRLWDGAKEIGVESFFAEDQFRRDLQRGYSASGYPEVSANIIVTPGELAGGYFDSGHPTCVVIIRPLGDGYAALRERGVAVESFVADRMLPGVKTTNYILGRIGLQRAQGNGAHEALYRDESGVVREGVTSNVMMLHGTTVRTPRGDCLDGVTLRAICGVCSKLGLTWEPGTVVVGDLKGADEVWLSSSLREILPVVQVDGVPVANGRPGPVFNRLYSAFRAKCELDSVQENEAFLLRLV